MDLPLTVIVPAYNGEKTIERAVNSLLCQTLQNLEIIIVNDGSKDNTAQIADRYASQDPRVRVIHKEKNEGLSAGRNSGMAVARGEYITFLDCDDWVEPVIYETMLQHGENADVIVTGAYHDVHDANSKVLVCTEDSTGESCTVTDKKEIIRWAGKLDRRRLFAYSWNKLFKRAFLQTCGVIYQQQTLIEDYQFNCGIWNQIEKLAIIDGCYYHYVKFSTEALTQRYLPDYFEIMTKRYTLMRSLYAESGLFTGEDRQVLCTMHAKHIIAGIVKNCNKKSGLSGAQQRKVIRQVLQKADCVEAMQYGKGTRIQEKVCNLVLGTRSVTVNYLFAKILYGMQNSRGNLFDKLK